MTWLLMSDDGLKGFTESLKVLNTTLDLATLASIPLICKIATYQSAFSLCTAG